jgi:hypothetical protein
MGPFSLPTNYTYGDQKRPNTNVQQGVRHTTALPLVKLSKGKRRIYENSNSSPYKNIPNLQKILQDIIITLL